MGHNITHVNDQFSPSPSVYIKILSKVVSHSKKSTFPFPAKSTHSSQSFSSTIFYKKSSPLTQAHSTLLSLSSFSHWFTRYLSSNEIPMAMFWELEMPCQKRQAGLPSWSTLYLYHTVHHQTDGSPAPGKKNRKNLS